MLAGFRSGRLNFIPFDLLVPLVVGIFLAAGADAVYRHSIGDIAEIGITLEGAVLQTIVSGLLLVLIADALRRNYVVYRPGELGPAESPHAPAAVFATARFESFGRSAFRYHEAASVHREAARLLLISPPQPASLPPPTPAAGPITGAAMNAPPPPEDPGEDHFWCEIHAWRVTEVETGLIYFGFDRSPAVRFRLVERRRRRQVHLAVRSNAQARWLYDWVDLARSQTQPH